jgi:hypothetical protein
MNTLTDAPRDEVLALEHRHGVTNVRVFVSMVGACFIRDLNRERCRRAGAGRWWGLVTETEGP